MGSINPVVRRKNANAALSTELMLNFPHHLTFLLFFFLFLFKVEYIDVHFQRDEQRKLDNMKRAHTPFLFTATSKSRRGKSRHSNRMEINKCLGVVGETPAEKGEGVQVVAPGTTCYRFQPLETLHDPTNRSSLFLSIFFSFSIIRSFFFFFFL